MCALRLVQHFTKIYYHNLKNEYNFNDQLKNIRELKSDPPAPNQEDSRKSLLPNRDAISELMAQLPATDFPELIEQILIQNYNHTRGDITDGPGDESRDIHTITQDGKKHLTQCRHTKISNKANLDRHDLDELWAATGRLNYEQGLLVTNADMTTPAKTTYLNGDYSRKGFPELKIWNGRNLWDEISKNQNLLNRWFSGLAQLHCVKRFSFSVLPIKMPQRKPLEIDDYMNSYIDKLKEQGFHIERSGVSWKVENSDFIIFMRECFTSAVNYPVPFIINPPHDFVTAPFSILEFHIIHKSDEIDHVGIRDFLSHKLLDIFENEDGYWTTLLASPILAPVYIHDTEDIIVAGIKSYTSYISLNNQILNENNVAFSIPCEFEVQDDDELVFTHRASGILFGVNYSQPIRESIDDTSKIIILKVIQSFRKSIVVAVNYTSDFEFSMALASVNLDNIVFDDPDDNKLYFCFQREENKEILKANIEVFLQSLKDSKLDFRCLESDDLIKMNVRLENELQIETSKERSCSSRNEFVVPIDLKSRVIASIAEIDIAEFKGDIYQLAFELFKYKMHEQHLAGYDEGFREGDNMMTVRQLKNILWRPTKIIGQESINIDLIGNSGIITLFIYFRHNRIESLSDALQNCHERMLVHIANIKNIMKQE